jgi:plastocyanin
VLIVPASASAATRVVNMGTPPSAGKSFQKFGVDVNAFFPSTTTVHRGDSVRFLPVGFHTLDLPAKGGRGIPLIVPQGSQVVSGAVDAAGAAFWFNGQPLLNFNFPALAPVGFGKTFTYTGAKRVESGLPVSAKPKPVTVKFAKTGTFTYYCDVHPGMKATVRVLAKSKAVPSARAHARSIKHQIALDLARSKNLGKTTPPANTVDVGVAGKGGTEFFGMAPATTTVPVGTTLTFRMSPGTYETHTATFGPGNIDDRSSYIGGIAASFASAAISPLAVYPSDPPGTVAGLTPTLHGNGFWNSGAMDQVAASPPPAANQVTFSAPGTYTYHCLIHTFMKGTVVVQ